MQSMRFKRWVARGVSVSVLSMILAVTTASAGQALLDAGFESGTDGFSARASETVERVSTGAYEGTGCLKVSNRGSAWNGAAISLGSAWKSGGTYSFSCAVKQDSGEAVAMQLCLEYSDASGEKVYAHIVTADVPSGEWTVLSEPAYQIPTGASSRVLYVETKESLCDFYVDSVFSQAPPHYRRGDVNHDDAIDKKDLNALRTFLLTKDGGEGLFPDTADMNGDGRLDVRDFSMLKQLFLYPELTQTTTTTTTTTPAPELKPGQWLNTADVSWINGRKTVALSFDDGPVTNKTSAKRIQDALTKQGFHATFFYQGNNINSGNEDEIREAEKRGFEVANHTWSHPDNLDKMDANGVMNEYTRCKDALNRILGVNRDYLVRLPFLKFSQTIANTLPVPFPNSGIDSGDWSGNSADVMVQKIQQAAQNGSLNGQVVLMHETYDTTATAVERLCPWLDQNGYAVVTVSEMFKVNNKDMFAGRVYNNCW